MVYHPTTVALAPPVQHGKPRDMSDDSLTQVLMRIQSAIGRIEAASARPVHQKDPAVEMEFAGLQRRHSILKLEAERTLADLDALLANAELAE